MATEQSSILVTLDSLLDTRLGTIAKINDEVFNKIVLDEKYHTRDTDVFEDIDIVVYKETYSNRNVETLSKSLLTNIILVLRDIISGLEKQAIMAPHNADTSVVINVYPYVLIDEELSEISKAISMHLSDLVKINFINMSPKELTPLYCKSNFAVMIMYDYGEWLETNAELFLVTQIPEITLFIPAIYFINKPTEEELNRLVRASAHPMKALKTLAMGIITLEIIDVTYFSIINKKF